MRTASFSSLPSLPAFRRHLPERLRQRAGAAVLAIAIEVLIALALLTMAPRAEQKKREADLKTFTYVPTPERRDVAKPSPTKARERKAGGASPIAPRAPRDAAPVRAPQPPITLPGVIPMRLADADISKLPSHAAEDADAGEGTGKGKNSGSTYGPGEGPGGEQLFAVAWYREPTHAELAGYLPNGAPPGGWAEIACRMIEHYHVENCRPLGESPVGSGLARAMRQAAWQFLVRPPRVGNKVMIGSWVRIRIDFSAGKDDE